MKTAMRELLYELKEASEIGSNPFITTTINLVIEMAQSKLDKEKQQIIEAYSKGCIERDIDKDYFNQTFNQPLKGI